MPIGLILSKIGLLNHSFANKFDQYLVSGTYAGELIEWKQYLPQAITDLVFKYSGDYGFRLLQEYLSSVFLFFVSSTILYFTVSTFMYLMLFVFFRKTFLPNHKGGNFKIWFDIKWSFYVIVFQSFAMSFLNLLIPRYSLVYYDINEYPKWWYYLTFLLHLAFNETWIYWTHYFGHYTQFGYQKLHWVHHVSIEFTPFSGWTFHPLDAFLQGCNTLLSCYFFPIHISVIQFYSLFGGLWSIFLHDNIPWIPLKIFMYSPNHTIHHIQGHGRLSNLGHMTTVWDRIVGTYEDPDIVDYGWHQFPSFIKFCNFFNNIYDQICPDRSSKWKGNKSIPDKKQD
ncbi:C-5 sterol desaturase (macronuclear) [Tetrahymena thermophila SB210]|uniref:C-5 sterol desaturase n=1 Tax=Tetrahymena thermophila (strain SB210) TaxID=312017 RepID=I7M9Z9_TETTS|nr:C-5 sterol desaturase [Tetrahymena thermophila SB210]EAS03127.1 C-5 sterol desaturase [Tetrahymena thermophila SB210]|eukprot:XP_001023372.1 C-5 sterol desaturase [Tetrahymena thermophila SB210]